MQRSARSIRALVVCLLSMTSALGISAAAHATPEPNGGGSHTLRASAFEETHVDNTWGP
ncbi:hypothetical protein [Streptomyces sp. NBC_00344]|uniref:hypothetical protein n=1 Tax=Streptomyces sp. NBC_00344 TaxID=2975720 RepID=UPI002E1D3105